VATIRLNTDCANSGSREQLSPGRFGVECVSVRDYIRGAYGSFGNGRNANLSPPKVVGGPDWIDADRYDIIAKAPADAGLDQMYGPIMRALLEDRFRLKVHKEIRELPVYALTVAKGASRLKASKAGNCVPIDLKNVSGSPPATNYCGITTKAGARNTVDGYGITLAQLADRLFREMRDRPVIDKTGLTGLFDIHLEYVPDPVIPGPSRLSGADNSVAPVPASDAGPSIFVALQTELGLKLSPDKGPVEVLVIDHIERPSGN
jgi:uncharacterized protein (TIGR03435 family)